MHGAAAVMRAASGLRALVLRSMPAGRQCMPSTTHSSGRYCLPCSTIPHVLGQRLPLTRCDHLLSPVLCSVSHEPALWWQHATTPHTLSCLQTVVLLVSEQHRVLCLVCRLQTVIYGKTM